MSDDEIAAYIAGKAVFDNIYGKMNLSKLETDRKIDKIKAQGEYDRLNKRKERELNDAKNLARSWQRTATEAITARDAWKGVISKLFSQNRIKAEKKEINEIFHDNYDSNIEANLNAMRRL